MAINNTLFKAWSSDPGLIIYSGVFDPSTLEITEGGKGCSITEPSTGQYRIQLPSRGATNIVFSHFGFRNAVSTVALTQPDVFFMRQNDNTGGAVTVWFTQPVLFANTIKFYKRETDAAAATAYPEIHLFQAAGTPQQTTMGVYRITMGAGGIGADAVNFARLIIRRYTSAGALVSTTNVDLTAALTAFRPTIFPAAMFPTTFTYDSGDTETLEITKQGAGVVLPTFTIERAPAQFQPGDISSSIPIQFFIVVKNSSA